MKFDLLYELQVPQAPRPAGRSDRGPVRLDHFISLMQADHIPHEQVMRSIELFAREIMPRFQ